MNETSFWHPWCYQYTHLSLTTFRKNGVPVMTALWFVAVGERIYMRTQARSGKVKRLAHTSEVAIAPCDDKGNVEEGTPHQAYGRVLDDQTEGAECAIAEAALQNRYGAQRTAMTELMQQQNEPLVYIALSTLPR